MSGSAVGVVAFDPDRELILSLVRSSLAEAGCVFVFVNGLLEDGTRRLLVDLGPRCRLIDSELNLGVAEALNMIALHAIVAGYSRVVFFDQDSSPPEGFLADLSKAMDTLQASGERVAVVGPAIVAPKDRERDYKSPRYFRAKERHPVSNIVPVRYVITSGSLVELSAFRTVGRFRSDFFIDSIDTEWCFRAWSRGFSCWYLPDVAMEHTIGQGVFLGRYPRQSAFRMYTWFRNQVVTISLPHVPALWKARLALFATMLAFAMLVDARFNLSIARLIVRALKDGWHRKLGPPAGALRTAELPSHCR